MVTIKDIAQIANVSASTVSRALNGKGKVSPEKQKEILQIANSNHYIPNWHAKVISQKSSKRIKNIGLVIPDITNPFFDELTRGIEYLNNTQIILTLADSFRDPRKEEAIALMFRNNGVDGIIIGNSRVNDDFVVELSKFLPVLVFDKKYNLPNVCSIILDNVYGAYIGTKHLIEIGCKKIVHLSGKSDLLVSSQRIEGYKKAINEAKLDIDIIETDYDKESGYESMKKFLRTGQQVDGIFCVNDIVALGAMKAVKESGFGVPKDIAIVGFDDTDFCDIVSPSLTSVHQPAREMGEMAVKMLLALINYNATIHEYVFSPSLVVRESTRR